MTKQRMLSEVILPPIVQDNNVAESSKCTILFSVLLTMNREYIINPERCKRFESYPLAKSK
jgi:hypothetical protein